MAERFREDLILDGKAPTTVKAYLTAMAQLSEHFSNSPDHLSEKQVRAFLLLSRERLQLKALLDAAELLPRVSSAVWTGRFVVNRSRWWNVFVTGWSACVRVVCIECDITVF